MFRVSACLVALLLTFINTSHGQVDRELCPDGPITFPDPQWHTVPNRFEITAELVDGNEVTEVSQAFSPTRDAIATSSNYVPLQLYWNFATNEQFSVVNVVSGSTVIPLCNRDVITPQSQTSVIAANTLFLKPSVLLGFNALNDRNNLWGNQFDGDIEFFRGIPAKRFKACFYDTDIRATVAATYVVSDTDKFQAYLPTNQSLILSIEVDVKNTNGKREKYTYNVFRYTPNPSRFEERQALETPAGVYCPNRTSTKPVPANIPERVTANSEAHLPDLGSLIISSHNMYDTEFEYTRFDAWYPNFFGGQGWEHLTEIHDFSVGLSYQFNHSNYQCKVTDLSNNTNDAVPSEDNPSLLQMGSPQHLFLLDDVDYQYTGEKPCRDRVLCEVFIGEKVMPNKIFQHREWYWASSINGQPLTQWIPMKMVIRQYVDGRANGTVELNLFNFRRSARTIFEIDQTLADCYRALGPAENYNLGVLSFKIGNEKNYPVFENFNYLRLHIWESLLFTLFVRPTRISHLTVDKDGTDIVVTFTLLDAPPRSGPVETPFKESSLDQVIERLQKIIDSDGIGFRARHGSKQVNLRTRRGSLNVLHSSNKKVDKTTGPRITGLWIGFIIIGTLLGGVGGFFVFQKLANK